MEVKYEYGRFLDRASLEDRLYLGNSQINLEFPSLIRTFAGGCPAKTDIEDEKGEEQRAAPVIYT